MPNISNHEANFKSSKLINVVALMVSQKLVTCNYKDTLSTQSTLYIRLANRFEYILLLQSQQSESRIHTQAYIEIWIS